MEAKGLTFCVSDRWGWCSGGGNLDHSGSGLHRRDDRIHHNNGISLDPDSLRGDRHRGYVHWGRGRVHTTLHRHVDSKYYNYSMLMYVRWM